MSVHAVIWPFSRAARRLCSGRASYATEPDRRSEVLGVPDPSDSSGDGSRQHQWTTKQMSRQVASAVMGETSLTVVGVRLGGRRADGADLRLTTLYKRWMTPAEHGAASNDTGIAEVPPLAGQTCLMTCESSPSSDQLY